MTPSAQWAIYQRSDTTAVIAFDVTFMAYRNVSVNSMSRRNVV